MKRSLAIALASLLLCSTLALASGSSGGSGLPSSRVDPFTVTESTKCTITEIQPDGTIIVQTKRDRFALNVTPKTEYRAAKPIEGRKKLKMADLRVGQKLRVTTRQANGEVMKVKVLKSS